MTFEGGYVDSDVPIAELRELLEEEPAECAGRQAVYVGASMRTHIRGEATLADRPEVICGGMVAPGRFPPAPPPSPLSAC